MNSIKAVAAACMAILGFVLSAAAERAIYPDPSHAQADLAEALKITAVDHRRIIVDFGGDWCTDCLVLDSFLHDSANKPLLEANYVLVHVNVGRLDRNVDLADRFQIPLKKGVPALAVLDSEGKVLFSQHTGEFEAMRQMKSSAVTTFLERWRPANE